MQLFQSLIQAFVIDRDVPRFRRVLEANDVLKPSDISDDDVREYFGHFYEFVLDDREVAFTPEYASETVRRMFDASSPYAHVAKSSNVPPAFVVTQRINLGLHAVLGRLRAAAQLAPHRVRALAVRRRRAVDADGRSRSRVARCAFALECRTPAPVSRPRRPRQPRRCASHAIACSP